MKSFISSILIISGFSTNIYTAYLLSQMDINILLKFFIVLSNTLALTWAVVLAVVLREVFGLDNFGWDNPGRRVK